MANETSNSGKKDRREKFVELAEKRVSKAIQDIRRIGKLSNTKNYSYTDEDIQKITKALRTEVDNLKTQFEAAKSTEEGDTLFKL